MLTNKNTLQTFYNFWPRTACVIQNEQACNTKLLENVYDISNTSLYYQKKIKFFSLHILVMNVALVQVVQFWFIN